MKRVTEKNIDVFNQDVKKRGKYQYTNFEKLSAYIATKRQSVEIIKLLKKQSKKNLTILDVGCGDGTFTFEIFDEIKPKKIVGFDSARSAINAANKKVIAKNKEKIVFQYCNIYDVEKVYAKQKFDIVIIRGVLHHLYDPSKAIKAVSTIANKIIVLEPNGYNPILKIIEKVSPYHIKHEERSYWPPTLNRWFEDNGFAVKEQQFCSIVPYFCPEFLARFLKSIEPIMESLPIRPIYCGTNVIYFEKIKNWSK